MSRYVDLDGLTWDGEPISSKIQEVKTKSGYMQGITVGWLWGDTVPHIDLAKHDKQIRDEVIEEVTGRLLLDYEELDNVMILDIIEGILEPMKGEQNG